MAIPDVTFRSELSGPLAPVRKELEEHCAVLGGHLSKEHDDGGRHTDITAHSIDAESGTFDELTVETLNAEGGDFGGTVTGVVNARPLRLDPAGAYTIAFTDNSLLGSGGTPIADEYASLWLLSAAADRIVTGIFASNSATGLPGHVLVLMNGSAFVLTFDSSVIGSDERTIYGCTPTVKVVPGGCIAFVYDGTNVGWRFVGVSRTTDLCLMDTDVSHALRLVAGSNLSAERTLTLTTGDAARTITLSGNPTLADWFDQSVKAAAMPTFAAANVTGVVDAGGYEVSGTPGIDATMNLLGGPGSGGQWDLTFVKGILTVATFTP